MAQTTARIKQKGKHFEIIVDTDKALKFKKGESSDADFLEIDKIFTDSKKGFNASDKDVEDAFGTTDVNTIAGKIVKNGEILLSHEHRDAERENKIKQVVDIISKMATDPKTGNPHTPERIKSALEEAHVNIKNTPIDAQIKDIIEEISKVMPVKIEEKKIKVTIPSIYTGKAYGVINQYKKENEAWLDNGDLQLTAIIPSGAQFIFFDKLNSVTHGAAITEEVREE